jgi:outer membrane protein
MQLRFSSFASLALTALLSTSLTSVPVQAQDASHPMSLKEAVNMALEKNPLIHQAQETVNAAEAQIPVTRAIIFPSLSLIGIAHEKTDPLNLSPRFGGDAYNQYSADLHLTQPLFAIGTFSAVKVVKETRDIRKFDLEISARNTTSNIVQAYFTVVLDMRNVDTLRHNERIQTEALGTAERRARTGRGQTLDVLQVKTQLALLKSQIATAANQLQIAGAILAHLLGDQNAVEYHVKDRLDAPDVSAIDKEIDLKKFHLPELEQNKIAIEQIDQEKRVALGTNLPTLNLGADYTYSAFKRSDLFDKNANGWDVFLTLNIPLFSGFSSIYQQQALNAQKYALEYSRQEIVNNTNLNQVSSRKQLETAEQSILEGREALRLAVASSDEARRLFRFATIDFLQLLTIEQAYVQAESSFNTYKYNYVVALANYFVNSGQDLNRLIDILEAANR